MLSKRIIAACAAAFAAVTLLAGCGGAAETAVPQAAEQKTMTIAEAGEYYTKTITPANTAMNEYNAAYNGGDMTVISEKAKDVATANETAVKQLKAKAWPTEAKKYLDAVCADLDAEAKLYRKAADVATVSEVDEVWSGFNSNGASVSLRKVLGLKSAEREDAGKMGETKTNGSLQLKLNSTQDADSILYDTCGDGCSNGEYAPKAPASGNKYYIVNVTVTNNSSESIDISCSLPLQMKAANEQDQMFDPIESIYQVKGNPACGNGLQPGQSADVQYPFEVPSSTKIVAFSWQDLTSMMNGGTSPAPSYFDTTA